MMIHASFSSVRRSRYSRAMFVSLLLTLSLLILASCGGTSTQKSQTSTSGGNISVGLNADVVTLDPVKSSALYDRQVMLNIYDTLVRVDQHNQIQPDLATSWSYTTPTQLVFTLRTDVTFQDGTPFNADAVVFNINRILTTPSSPRFSELASVQSIQAVDASHVQFTLKSPFSPLLATLTDRSGMMLSPTAVKKLGANLANGPVNAGSGPFEFSDWVKGDHLLVKKNPHYWQKDAQGQSLPYLDSVRFKPITDSNTEFSNLQTGAIQAADTIAPTDVTTAQSSSNLVYKQIPGLSFYGFELNTKAPPFDNPDVRRAVEWGVNRQEIVTNALKDTGVVAQGPIAPSSWAFSSSFTPYSYNISNAKAALAKAGKSNLSFTMLISSGSPLGLQIAQFIQSELQPAGITVVIKQETFATLLSDTMGFHFQASFLGWSGRPDPDGNIYSYFHTGGGNNDMQYSNPQVDTLLDAARTSSDQATRTTDYRQAEQMIMQDAPYVFIYHGISIQATTTNVKNFTLLPTGMLTFTNVSLAS
ncbi:MAG TPA: ABC transporter substrate-binding protein [Ktedonobacteraceae bacterium]